LYNLKPAPNYILIYIYIYIYLHEQRIVYSCMNNVKSIITKHNTHIIRNSQSQNTETDNCNCDNRNTYPLPKQCMTNNIIYMPQSQQTTRTTLNTTSVWQRLHLRNVTLTTLHLFVIKKTQTKRNFRNIFGN
jgi:hypothetical protein